MAAFGEFSGSVLVSDASVLINFLRIDRMDLIAAVSYEFMATDHVTDEISEAYPEQRVCYQAALDRGAVAQVSLTDPDELELFAMLAASGRLGKGECSAIACAIHRGYALAIDDRRAVREATAARSDLEIVRTQDLIVSMLKQNLLSIAEADAIKDEWEQRHRFRLKISSFAELLS